MKERIINEIQKAYNQNRAPEMWGTPQVSPGFFEHLKSEGLRGAWNYLVERERAMGNLSARPELKAVANLLGSALLALGVRRMSGISEEEYLEGEYNRSLRQKVGEAVLGLTFGLLFFAQGEGTSHMGYLGKDPSEWNKLYKADLTSGEQKIVEREFDPELDGCQMDTIARIFPEKLEEV